MIKLKLTFEDLYTLHKMMLQRNLQRGTPHLDLLHDHIADFVKLFYKSLQQMHESGQKTKTLKLKGSECRAFMQIWTGAKLQTDTTGILIQQLLEYLDKQSHAAHALSLSINAL